MSLQKYYAEYRFQINDKTSEKQEGVVALDHDRISIPIVPKEIEYLLAEMLEESGLTVDRVELKRLFRVH